MELIETQKRSRGQTFSGGRVRPLEVGQIRKNVALPSYASYTVIFVSFVVTRFMATCLDTIQVVQITREREKLFTVLALNWNCAIHVEITNVKNTLFASEEFVQV